MLKDQCLLCLCLFVHAEWILIIDADGNNGWDMNFWIGKNGCLGLGISLLLLNIFGSWKVLALTQSSVELDQFLSIYLSYIFIYHAILSLLCGHCINTCHNTWKKMIREVWLNELKLGTKSHNYLLWPLLWNSCVLHFELIHWVCQQNLDQVLHISHDHTMGA